ncbi:hypothetical protein HYS91_01300 [Candidatus Daviesbacteria bacterium]|nr:hypothetical protein [Candidatus Daviesbacteria bacterium]
MIRRILALLIIILLPLLLVTPILAQEIIPTEPLIEVEEEQNPTLAGLGQVENIDRKETIVLPKDQIINKDYFAMGESITISGTINGDAYLAGGNILVEGDINGDLLVAGGSVNIRGKVSNDLRVGGGQVNITGEVGRNITVFGGVVNISDSAVIGGSIVSGAGSLNIFAPVPKDITAGAGQLTLASTVSGDVLAGVGKLMLTSNANVAGDIKYFSSDPLDLQPGATISGEIRQLSFPKERLDKEKIAGQIARFGFFVKLFSALSLLIIGVLLINLVPIYTQKNVNLISERPWLSLFVGFLALILTPFLIFVLLITIVGLPLALILLVIYLILLYISPLFIMMLIGQKLMDLTNRKINLSIAFIVGLIIYEVLTLIPVIGWIIMFVSILVGMGAILIERKRFYISLKDKKLI